MAGKFILFLLRTKTAINPTHVFCFTEVSLKPGETAEWSFKLAPQLSNALAASRHQFLLFAMNFCSSQTTSEPFSCCKTLSRALFKYVYFFMPFGRSSSYAESLESNLEETSQVRESAVHFLSLSQPMISLDESLTSPVGKRGSSGRI